MNSKDDKPSPQPASGSKRSGRVAHDARGNPVWEWQTSTGVYEKDVTTKSLRKLEAPGLSLMDTQTVVKAASTEKQKPKVEPKPQASSNDSFGLSLMDTQAVIKEKVQKTEQAAAQAKPAEALPGGGMNPYDNGGLRPTPRPKEQPDPSKLHPALAHKQPVTRKDQPRQSIQTKYHAKTPAKPKGLLDKIKSALRGK